MPRTIKFDLPVVDVPHNCDRTINLLPPHFPFIPTGIVIPDDIAPHFLITNVAVGLDSQLISTGAIPASLFAESSLHHNLTMDPVDTKKLFRLSATNISDQPRRFTASVEGIPAGADVAKPSLQVIGYGNTTILGNSSGNINVQPQLSFIPQWLHVPPHVLEHFVILEIFISSLKGPRRGSVPEHFLTKQQLVRSGAICLIPDLVAPQDHFVTIVVTNLSAQSRNFQAAILGPRAS